jgi:hypothetical protein
VPVPTPQNEGYGAEIRWDISSLNLIPGHSYRVYFMVHDGDQNKTGGDSGQACGYTNVYAYAYVYVYAYSYSYSYSYSHTHTHTHSHISSWDHLPARHRDHE